MPILPQRRSIRLEGYDYAESGAYFVTICTHEKKCLFGTVREDTVLLNEYGQIAFEEWEQIAVLRPNISLDAFVVMPNHIHGVILLSDNSDLSGSEPSGEKNLAPTEDDMPRQQPRVSLASIVGAYKAGVSRRINRLSTEPSLFAWQRNYYEHVIRNEADLNRIRLYVEINPARWTEDSLFSR